MATRRFGVELSPDRIAVWSRGDGLLVEEPAVLARQPGGRPLAFGAPALELAADRPQNVELSWPLGVARLADAGAAEQLLREVILKVVGRLLFSRHEVMLGVPAQLDTAGRRSLLEAALASGARMAHVIDVPLAAALGSGLPVAAWSPIAILYLVAPSAQMAVIAHEGLLTHASLAPPGGAAVGEGSAWEGREALERLASLALSVVEELPSELQSQVRESGLVLAGRQPDLVPLGERLQELTGIAARVVPDPAHCVAKGTELALERIDALGSQGLLYLR